MCLHLNNVFISKSNTGVCLHHNYVFISMSSSIFFNHIYIVISQSNTYVCVFTSIMSSAIRLTLRCVSFQHVGLIGKNETEVYLYTIIFSSARVTFMYVFSPHLYHHQQEADLCLCLHLNYVFIIHMVRFQVSFPQWLYAH